MDVRRMFADLTARLGAERTDALARAGLLVEASAPGRVELAGNHVDHQGGCTISAAIDQRVFALAAPWSPAPGTGVVVMDGFGQAAVSLDDLSPHPEERGSSAALVRGMLAGYACAGRGRLSDFTMIVASEVPAGLGVSSSAAFEMMLGMAFCRLFDEPGAPPPDPVGMALWGSQTEQRYFGKLAGAQDQLASAFGGVSLLDFEPARPLRSALRFDPGALGCALMLVDSRCEHAQHTEEFSAISRDMQRVAAHLGAGRLIEVPYETFLSALPEVRMALGDRSALRALHFFEETRRVRRQAQALAAGDTEGFLQLVRRSGASSAQYLQNISPTQDVSGAAQPAAVVLALCAHLLDGESLGGGRGAFRIHGGGFGGCVLAFVPDEHAEEFAERMDGLLGYKACTAVRLSPHGACAAAFS